MNNFDVLVVGSGATGGWAAKSLTQRGLRVALLDAGPQLNAKEDFQRRLISGKAKQNIDRIDGSMNATSDRQFIQASCYAYTPSTKHLFVDDLDNPYEVVEGKPFNWIRCRQVGGRSNLWARVAIRMSDFQFKGKYQNLPSWPITYQDVSSHYDEIEDFFHVSGYKENHPEVPDGIFIEDDLPPQYSELALKKAAVDLWPGNTRLFRLRTTTLAQPYVSMISREALPFYSSSGSTIPSAINSGLVSVIPNAVVHRIIMSVDGKKAQGVEYFDAMSGESKEVTAKVVMLCASTLESTRILLNSKSGKHPNGVGNSSGVLGHFLMDHVCGAWVSGTKLPSLTDERDTHIYMPPIRVNSSLPVGAQGYLSSKSVKFIGFGEMRPRYENQVTISEELKDKWGIPALKIECEYSEEEKAATHEWRRYMEAFLTHAGYKTNVSTEELSVPGSGIHEVGTARMGSDRKNSILNPYCRSWDVPNLFVTDGSAFVTSSYHNPTLTMLALTNRACVHIAENFSSEFA
ncbi:GMC oxidoreductase [Cellvibrio mixtus]|uniref:GMC oxidoreductase n=1 Tax=Cellvibrio mixtus TaxID=39650 RepID=UPI0005864B0C|nr:GMC family oxidoreductase [Cellvibrio mixtus]